MGISNTNPTASSCRYTLNEIHLGGGGPSAKQQIPFRTTLGEVHTASGLVNITGKKGTLSSGVFGSSIHA